MERAQKQQLFETKRMLGNDRQLMSIRKKKPNKRKVKNSFGFCSFRFSAFSLKDNAL